MTSLKKYYLIFTFEKNQLLNTCLHLLLNVYEKYRIKNKSLLFPIFIEKNPVSLRKLVVII